jgi:hypothetical protein
MVAGDAVKPKSSALAMVAGGAKPDLAAFSRNSPDHEDYLGYLRTCGDHRRWRDLCGRGDDKQSDLSRCP